jgi:hypothetical protein
VTKAELKVLDMLGDAYTAFTQLPQCHDSDLLEFEQAVHRAQNIIMARDAIRNHPKYFSVKEGFK